MQHLSRYDYILMLRAIWEKPVIHYQVVDIPVDLLRFLGDAKLQVVKRRSGRKSLSADIIQKKRKLFNVYFDGADGKCQIRRLAVDNCQLLRSWDYQFTD
jgi:hypothetical protein